MPTRREFLHIAGSAAALAACQSAVPGTQQPSIDTGRLRARPSPTREHAGPGLHLLHLGGNRDGFYSVPDSYADATPAPLLLMLHGATQQASMFATDAFDTVLGRHGIVMLAPDSRDYTWDLSIGGFGPDVDFIDRALALVFARCSIDPAKIAIGGFSDGASYSLSLGTTNGDLFARIMAFSPGFYSPAGLHGRPPVYETHGTRDTILPIDKTSRRIVPGLRAQGYDVTYVEFDGGHRVTPELLGGSLDWWLGPAK